MSQVKSYEIVDLENKELIRLVGMFLGHVLAHYGMWFTETSRILNNKKALEFEADILPRHFHATFARLAPHFGIETTDGIPEVLLKKSREELLLLISDIAKTWVTGDGLWFQAIEGSEGMVQAKTVNDSCWSLFARLEAFKIKGFMGLEVKSGLDVLEQALKLRIYSTINAHSTEWDAEGNLLFNMTECRVQAARRRKDLDDYPCKSAGITEYTEFALGVDPNIVTECVWCPPDRVPNQQFCAWKFSLKT